MIPNHGHQPPSPAIFRSLWMSSFWISFPFGILAFVLPVYGRQLGATAFQIGMLYSALSLFPVLIRPFLGRALDRWGRRPFLLAGLAGYLVAMILFAAADSIGLLTLARLVQGLGQALLWISAYTIVADLATISGRGLRFGSIDEAASRGALIGTTLGFAALLILEGRIQTDRLWSLLFLAYLVPSLIGFTFGWKGVPESRPNKPAGVHSERPLSGQLLALMGIVLVTGASYSMVWPMLMLLLQDVLGANVGLLAIAYLPAAILNSVAPSHLGRLADRFGRKPLMIAGLMIAAAASLAFPHLRSLSGLAALWTLESFATASATPAERAFVADIAGEDARGTSYGLYTFAYFLGAVVGPLAGGWLYDNYGRASPFYLNAIVLSMGAAMVLLFLRETRPKKAEQTL